MIVHLILILLSAVLTRCIRWEPEHCNNEPCNESGYKTWLERQKEQETNLETNASLSVYIYNCQRCYRESLRLSKSSLGFTVSLNKFATTMEDDFLDFSMNNPISLAENWRECNKDIPPLNDEMPDSINWTVKGAVTPVINQRNCISSWAFSAVGVMEAYRVIKFNETLMTLSAQNLIDCTNTSEYGNDGCYGGDVINAFRYVKEKGINADSVYPYEAKGPKKCLYDQNNSIKNLAQDFRCVSEGDENQLKAVVSQFGPVAVSIDARRWNFRFYGSGIYHDHRCCNLKHCLNHAMLVVGYGTDEGVDYWWLKNSWGNSWGENGYMRIARNRNNTCGVATAGLYLV